MNEKITAQPPKEERQEVLKEIRQLENRKKILENKQRKAFKIAIVPSADRSMDTCTVCQTRRGHDYVVMNR